MKMRATVTVGAVSAVALCLLTPIAAQATGRQTLYVAPNGRDGATCTRSAPCRTISHAVRVAKAGSTVLVAPGTYRDSVTISKKISLIAQGPRTTIDAAGAINGIGLGVQFTTPTSPRPVGDPSGSVVQGFQIENARQEGIVAVGANLRIAGNTVTHNDRGAFSKHPAGECAGQGQVPGDCGEGIHLAGVMHSLLTGNHVTGNVGGMLISDEFGPTAFNKISGNTVANNTPDCGITLAAHNGNAVASNGHRQPARGGVYRNEILNNVVNGNGAAGIGFFAGGPGTGSYDNLAVNNRISGNGIPGVAIHTHPGPHPSDANGNRIIGNFFSRNGLGEGGRPPLGDPDTPVNKTTDIDVVADPGATPVSGTLIENNQLTHVTVGIWLVTSGHTQLIGNTFSHVGVPVKHS